LVTGGSMAPFLKQQAPRLAQATGADVEVVHVTNRYFGETVTIAGLLAGEDILAALEGSRRGDVVVFPAEALNGERAFIDNLPVSEFVARLGPAEVHTGFEITEALRAEAVA
jgi:NifB/MoaA-like Fe-S oxidoreductase